jgi:hypothetical protein
VPEASVIRGVQALSGFTGRKAYRRCPVKSTVQAWGSTPEQQEKLAGLSMFGEARILGGGVKSVDIERNTSREGVLLGHY